MRLSIVPEDGAVYVDGVSYLGLDLSFIPADVHALQWYGSYGELEFKRSFVDGQIVHPINEVLTELPVWANSAKEVWDAAKTAEEIAAEEARIEAEQLLNTEQNINNTIPTSGAA